MSTEESKHSPRFVQLVNEAKQEIKEIEIETVKERLAEGYDFILIDVREESEFEIDHITEAVHMSKGIIERDIEARCPGTNTELVLYCGGGYRSALCAHNLKRMGYKKVLSMAGGFRAWQQAGYKTEHSS